MDLATYVLESHRPSLFWRIYISYAKQSFIAITFMFCNGSQVLNQLHAYQISRKIVIYKQRIITTFHLLTGKKRLKPLASVVTRPAETASSRSDSTCCWDQIWLSNAEFSSGFKSVEMQISKEVTSHVQKHANTDEGWKIFKMKIMSNILFLGSFKMLY